MNLKDRVLGGLWGALVGDALGVPVEFRDRAERKVDPVTGMRGFGSHHQPPGTWSDDGALTLCSVESLLQAGFDAQAMGQRFVRWMNDGLWTATGDVFDIGLATTDALMRIGHGVTAENAGGQEEYSNGNGSLMRILPVAMWCANLPKSQLADRLERASAITHGHVRSKMACVFHGLVVCELLSGATPARALAIARNGFAARYAAMPEAVHFRAMLDSDIAALEEAQVVSSGYVLHTLHASLWCLLSSSNYEESVLKAANLGGDADTTACVAGGLAGVAYGVDAIPVHWRTALPRQSELQELLERFAEQVEDGKLE